jgi:two-component system, chemotaxis family, response regulator WspR
MSINDATPVALAAAAEHAIKVLLVDDQLIVGEAIRRLLLNDPKVELHYCANPNEAVSVAKAIRATVILQDLVMPGVNGLDLVRQYRGDQATAGIPIIVLSSKGEPSVKSDAFQAGANDYLVKLPDQIELIARIRYHSKAYVNHLQRDEAYRALHESQRQLMETNRELERLTNVDGLTALSNRRYFNEYMGAEWKRAVRSRQPLSILMIDVDHFKQYNDTYGHIAGDDVLRKVADCLKHSCRRSTDLAARYGGEEFAIILPETPFADIQRLGDKVCQAVEALSLPHSGSSAAKCVTISIGGATTIPQHGEAFPQLVDAADKALYAAKRAGRNRAATRDQSP